MTSNLIRSLLRFTLLVVGLGLARSGWCDVPLCTDPFGTYGPTIRVSYGGSSAHLALFWSQGDATEPADVRFRSFGRGSPPVDVLPAQGSLVVSRPFQQIDLQAATVVGRVCPPANSCEPTVLAYCDFEDPPGDSRVRARRLFDGPEWDVSPGTADAGYAPQVISDGFGGAILGWILSAGITVARVQKLSADGELMWGNSGLQLATGTSHVDNLQLVPDDAGGAYFIWMDWTGIPDSSAIKAIRRTSTGAVAPGWPASGRTIRSSTTLPAHPRAISDGQGGVFLAWGERDLPGGAWQSEQVRMCRLLGDGSAAPGWPAEGLITVSNPGYRNFLSDIQSDGGLGVLLAVHAQDTSRVAPDPNRGIVQHILADGSRPAGWPASGVEVSTSAGHDYWPVVCASEGGLIAAWTERSGTPATGRVLANRFLADGSRAPEWPATGLPISTLPGEQWDPLIGSDGFGGAILAWSARGVEAGSNVTHLYGTAVTANATLSVREAPTADIDWALAGPNPTRGRTRAVLSLSEPSHVRIEALDVLGRRVALVAEGRLGVGPHAFDWDTRSARGSGLEPGLYYLRARTDRGERTRAVVVTR